MFTSLMDKDSKYKTFGMSYATADGCNMAPPTDLTNGTGSTSCGVVLDLVAAEAFADASSVTQCGTEINYGGDLCKPSADAIAVYEQINSMRLNTATWA